MLWVLITASNRMRMRQTAGHSALIPTTLARKIDVRDNKSTINP